MESSVDDKYYGYIRVSTQIQADEGISLENQRKKIEAWGIMNDKVLVKIFADQVNRLDFATIHELVSLDRELQLL